MRQTTRRPALVLALLWIGCGWIAPAHGGIVLQTPAGLAPGDQFRFAFLTTGTTNAESSNISDYDSFVNAQAQGATYNGQTVTWQAIGSTATVNAIDHIGQTDTPVYRVDGALVATNTTLSGLWSSSLINAIDEDITGTSNPFVFVWTGSTPAGIAGIEGSALGENAPWQGFAFSNNNPAWVQLDTNGSSAQDYLYGISEVLTVGGQAVPEPSSMVLLCAGGVMVAGYGWIRRHRDLRQGPVVGPTDMP